jgi:hypothetical protein
MNPYSGLPNHRFWRRSVANVDRHEFDPVVSAKFLIAENDRIATAGSCFAQHISRKLDDIGFNYFVPEHGAGLPADERSARHYRVFSVRSGNIYTPRQLVQLFDEAFNGREHAEQAWMRPDGRFVDPYRPAIEPAGFADADAVRLSRQEHLQHVRTMFRQADVFVFTLGLTEGWFSKADGSVFPLAPGVSGGTFDPNLHGFVNFTVADVEHDLRTFLDSVKAVNPDIKILLTVSPVPLIATYEDRNVLVSTTYSKSVLRVAAETAYRAYDWVDYFPSFEIITGSFNFGAYYAGDAREVNHLGVAHAMRVFLNNYLPGRRRSSRGETPQAAMPPSTAGGARIICDEESIAQISR